MHKITPSGGDHLYTVLVKAVEQAPAEFDFNDMHFETRVGETLGDARQRFKEENGMEVLTPDESADAAGRWLEETRAKQAADIANSQVPTEQEMRTMKAPWPKTEIELTDYIRTLVDRPHDYGTCVYAMSLAATAAFYYVARRLRVSGFQASCADMDILRQTREWEWGRLLNYDDLLFPQYCNDEHFPSWRQLILSNKIRPTLAQKASAKLDDPINHNAHPDVRKHWERLAGRGN